jgi:hypothetical protein
MPPFPVPAFSFDYLRDEEIAALRRWRDTNPAAPSPPRPQAGCCWPPGSWPTLA